MKFYGSIGIYTSLTLDELGTLLSERVFGGIEFGGKDLGLCDEVPAVRLERRFLGLYVILYGGDGEYALSVDQRADDIPAEEIGQDDYVNLDDHLAFLVGRIEGIDKVSRRCDHIREEMSTEEDDRSDDGLDEDLGTGGTDA